MNGQKASKSVRITFQAVTNPLDRKELAAALKTVKDRRRRIVSQRFDESQLKVKISVEGNVTKLPPIRD